MTRARGIGWALAVGLLSLSSWAWAGITVSYPPGLLPPCSVTPPTTVAELPDGLMCQDANDNAWRGTTGGPVPLGTNTSDSESVFIEEGGTVLGPVTFANCTLANPCIFSTGGDDYWALYINAGIPVVEKYCDGAICVNDERVIPNGGLAAWDGQFGTDILKLDGDTGVVSSTGSLAVTGTITGKSLVPIKITAASYTIGTTDPNELYGGVIIVTGAATITIPAVVVGASFTVKTRGAVAVSVDPNAADRLVLDGTALADGDKATNTSTTGDMLVCEGESSAGWDCVSGSNDGDLWTDGN